jgi:vacuolar-type H+-ATPase subunit D/Vma8
MTDEQMKEQLQAAQDMIETLAQQRDANANQIVQLVATNKSLQRKLAEYEKTDATDASVPKTNGTVEAPASIQ